MKKGIKILILTLSLLLTFSLFSCGDDPTPETVRVMVAVGEGFTVTTDNPVDVEKGGTATFTVDISEGYVFESTSAGEFDPLTGVLTIADVNERTNVTFTVKKVDYNTNAFYSYFFHGSKADTTSIRSNPSLQAGTQITVKAGETTKIFIGWSFGKSTKLGGTVVSTDKEFTFNLEEKYAEDGSIHLYANYLETNVLIYDANGGGIVEGTFNNSKNEYYTVSTEGTRLRYTMLQKYYDYAGCASTFWDDGTFVRDGYVLREYNTRPDGTGEGYSLGSKFYTGTDTEYPVLYCIWDEATPVSDFEYGNEIILKPDTKLVAPGWQEQGIKIISYKGTAEHVTVPEKIDGLPVISVAAGAFVDKGVKSVTLPKTLLKIEDGAFVGCSSLETLYFPNSIYYLSDAIFDGATYTSFKNLIVNATMAPRNGEVFSVKLCKLLRNPDAKKIIVISGSSSYQSLGSEYLEALLDKEYKVINFGTTRPRLGAIYLEALSHYTDSDDIFVYAPENSAYMYGESLLWWRMVREMEGMNNLFRYIDISNYTGYFNAFRDLNQSLGEPGKMGYYAKELRYESICNNSYCDENGDYQNKNREKYVDDLKYTDSYYITLNNRVKSITEALWSDEAAQEKDKDYTDPTNHTWSSIDDADKVARLNFAINKARSSGAKVYFGYAPSDADALVDEARNRTWLAAFDTLIDELYDFDGRLGGAADYVYNHQYFYDCAFHTNDYGRTWRTYDLYLDICEKLGKSDPHGFKEMGTVFDGCLFESVTDSKPIHKVDYLQ